MKISYVNQYPPRFKTNDGRIVNVKVSSKKNNILEAVEENSNSLRQKYDELGMERCYVHDLTIGAPDIDDVMEKLP
ncbi:hypothetical protein, partial [Pseudovibrio sp. WM33]